MFKEGDVVVCLYNDARERGEEDFSSYLTVGKHYTVASIGYSSKRDKQTVGVYSDDGSKTIYFSSRFSLAEEASPHQAVINKIKYMESKRKSLGYRW